MSNINGKLNLMQLKAVRMNIQGKTGKQECLVIPIAANNLFVGEKGIYLDLIAFEKKTHQENNKDTHIVKQSLSKEALQAMTDEEKQAMPILGSLRVWGEFVEPDAVSDMTVKEEIDPLPF
jgi:hypothetical protein